MNKGLEALERIKDGNGISYKDLMECFDIIEKELKALELIKKCFYVVKSSGAILQTDYGYEHEEELKEVLL